MTESNETPQVREVGAGLERSAEPIARPGHEQHMLDPFIGKWLTEGGTVAAPGLPSVPIVASDIYEWAPGGFFVIHLAYGRIGDTGVGGVEIISWDAEAGLYRAPFYDSMGNVNASTLSVRDGVWIWEAERTRCTGTFSDDGQTFAAHHERSDDGNAWEPSMEVVLRRIA
jgi:hypothetical protein